jgi:NADH-quinone oxidoreductase subunit L
MFLTFYGEARGQHTHDHAHESPMTMLVPLGVLAVGAVFSGVVWYNSFFGKTDQVATFLGSNTWTRWPRVMAMTRPMAMRPMATTPMAMRPWPTPMASGRGRPRVGSPLRLHQPTGRCDPRGPRNDVLNEAHYVPLWVKFSPFAAMILGFVTAYWFYILNPSIPGRLAPASGRSTTSC